MSTEQLKQEREWSQEHRPPKRYGLTDWLAGIGPWLTQSAVLVLPALLGLTLVFVAWEAWIAIKDVQPYLVPAPSAVFVRLYEEPWLFIEEGLMTLEGA